MDNSDTSLLLSLKHTQSTIRVSAMEHLMGVITSGQVGQNTLLGFYLQEVKTQHIVSHDSVVKLISNSLHANFLDCIYNISL